MPITHAFVSTKSDGSDTSKVRATQWNANHTGGGKESTLTVAASDATTDVKNQADYLCDGTADNVQIQAAIDLLTLGGTIILSNGNFSIAASITLDNYIDIKGSGKKATKLTWAGASGGHILTYADGIGDWSLSDMWIYGSNLAEYLICKDDKAWGTTYASNITLRNLRLEDDMDGAAMCGFWGWKNLRILECDLISTGNDGAGGVFLLKPGKGCEFAHNYGYYLGDNFCDFVSDTVSLWVEDIDVHDNLLINDGTGSRGFAAAGNCRRARIHDNIILEVSYGIDVEISETFKSYDIDIYNNIIVTGASGETPLRVYNADATQGIIRIFNNYIIPQKTTVPGMLLKEGYVIEIKDNTIIMPTGTGNRVYAEAAVATLILKDNYLTGGVACNIAPTSLIASGNTGFTTENHGVASNVTLDASGVGVIAHGCATTPSYANVICQSANLNIRVSSIDATNINIIVYDLDNAVVTADTHDFYWKAEV